MRPLRSSSVAPAVFLGCLAYAAGFGCAAGNGEPDGGGSGGGVAATTTSVTSPTGTTVTTTTTATTDATTTVATTDATSDATTTADVTTTADTSSSTGGGENLHELDPCTQDGDCASPLVCRPMVKGGEQRCTRTCSSNAACMTGTVCQLIGSTQYCAGDDTGRACTQANTCNFACLTNQQYCTKNCTTGGDCPNGYGCMTVQNQKICVKDEVACTPNDPNSLCIAPAACDSSTQMVVDGCTSVCSTAADCPTRAAGLAPWTCDAGGICRRPGDVYGPLENGATPAQYACNAQSVEVNVCNDGQHIDFKAFVVPNPPAVNCVNQTSTTSGTASDSCVDSCRYQGGCPYGFYCTALGSISGNRIGLCLPTGSGEVGAVCTYDSDCAFGYCATALGKCSRDCTYDGICPGNTTCTAAGGPNVEGKPFRRCQ